MNYEITNLTKEKIKDEIISNVIKETEKELKIKNSLVSIVLVDADFIKEINKKYRNIDSVTDVISFAYLDEDTNPLSEITNLGEIYICISQARVQALEYNHSFERELSFLTAHGLLHLLGYDHMTKSDELIMFSLQEKILKNLGVER